MPMLAVSLLSMLVLGGLAVLPARTWWSQREEMNRARSQLTEVESEVVELRAKLELLQTDGEIERLAKADYGMVYPAEESYVIVDD